MEKYDVYLEQEVVGTVRMTRSGLYYQIECLCEIPGQPMLRLLLVSDSGTLDLGTCVPMDKLFGVRTKLPVKKLGRSGLRFYLAERGKQEDAQFVPVFADRPFAYLDKLESCVYKSGAEVCGVVIKV